MNRFAALAAGAALLFSTGCTHDGQWSVQKALGLDDNPQHRVATPNPKTLPPASLATSQRVDELGRKLVAQNTFCGFEPGKPLFMVTGHKEAILFHRGTDELIISEGIVEKCQSEAELAAVLCWEMGQMVAEKRTAKALGREVDPIPDANYGGGPIFPGGTAVDAGQMANLAFHERKFPRTVSRPDPVDAAETARELLKGSGYSPAELDR